MTTTVVFTVHVTITLTESDAAVCDPARLVAAEIQSNLESVDYVDVATVEVQR